MPFPVKVSDLKAFRDRGRLSAYFDRVVREYAAGEAPCVFLPSLMALSRQLGCSPLEIQRALTDLRREGYDFFYLGRESPVTFWAPSKICLAPQDVANCPAGDVSVPAACHARDSGEGLSGE